MMIKLVFRGEVIDVVVLTSMGGRNNVDELVQGVPMMRNYS